MSYMRLILNFSSAAGNSQPFHRMGMAHLKDVYLDLQRRKPLQAAGERG
jgi:hypothetical protein